MSVLFPQVPARISIFFFFSSRRRHTRYWRDWSSDVCSSDLVRHHGAADRAKGGGDKAEEPHQVIRNTGNSQQDAYRESCEGGGRSRDFRQHGAETVRRNERRKAGWHHRSNGEEEEHYWRQSTDARDRGRVVVALGSGATAQIAGDRKNWQATGDQCSADDTKDAAEKDVLFVGVVHPEIGTGSTGCCKVSDYDRKYIEEADCSVRMGGMVVRDASSVGIKDDEDHDQRNPVQKLGDTADVVNAFDGYPAKTINPNDDDDA